MTPLIWIIDEEWPDYDMERKLLRERYPDCDIRFSSYDYAEDLENFGKDADAILCQIYATLPREAIERLTRCKAIAVYGGGFDRVDIVAAREKGIKVTNISNYCKEDLADYTMAAVYFFYKQVAQLSAEVKTLPWGAQAIERPPMRLSESVMHIIGLGRIGREVAAKAKGNGLKVTAYDPYVSAEEMAASGVAKTGWDEGLAGADYISVNCILNEETTGLIKYEDFEKMKSSAYLVNTARGKVIDEEAMVRALEKGLIKGAMLDVIATEPPTYSEKIFGCQNAYVTPHVSYISVQSFEELKRRAVGNAVMGMEGKISPDLVNG
ncbi:phosphoglycerate dehydrogenase family protein [Deltaproteobacteria bacterium Smac51]|nr:phosphoglycerate dehydrogenase family protein [Deltaproteobacteria bacterium Smac51]